MRVLLALAGAVIAAVLLAVVCVPLALAVPSAAPPAGAPGLASDGAVAGPAPPPGAVADIPRLMLSLYVTAARRCPGLPWTVLAAIGKVETDHGRGPEVSPAGAEGPMQFMPATWAVYGVDGDGDGVASVWDPADAIPAAADLLCADGGGSSALLNKAIFAYNHADSYVQLVLAWANLYGEASAG